MDRIFMTRIKSGTDRKQVKLAVFLKGDQEHLNDLMGFLRNQSIDCSEIPHSEKKQMQEFSYFDGGFFITIAPSRWSFYELRSYIQTYADTCDDNVILRDTLLQELSTCDEGLVFDDRFYVELTREIGKCTDRYYQENLSISLYTSGILKLLRQNLQLYWAAAKLMDILTSKVSYLNHDPPSLPRKEILKACSNKQSESVTKLPIEFCGEHIADIFVRPGPFSPKPSVINKFLSYVIMQVDDFIYGHLTHKKETVRLKSEIAELRQQQQAVPLRLPERESKTLKKLHLILLGDSHLSNGQIYSEFLNFGFERQNIEVLTEYDKYRAFDTNKLLAVRSKYDGILLGPMPHSMKGDLTDGVGLIAQMQHEPERYPPFVVLRDKRGKLKITKSSLKNAIDELADVIERVGNYA